MLTMDKVEAPYLASAKLPPVATIVVVGAYKGDTVAFLREHQPHARILAYEPQHWACWEMMKRFNGDKQVVCVECGLGAGSRSDVLLYEFETDAASLLELEGWRKVDSVELLDIAVLARPSPQIGFNGEIDLMVMNIEGYEYTLIPYMLGSAVVPEKLLVQFHFTEKFVDELFRVRDLLVDLGYKGTALGKGWEAWELG